MTETMTEATREERPTLVLGCTGKTGRRVVDPLSARRLPVRAITTAATKTTRAFAETAIEQGVTRLVMLTGGGENEAQAANR